MLTLALLLVLVTEALPQLSQTFTANGTFTVPAGVTQVTVECWGGGGRGGSRSSNGRGGGGGGGGYARSLVTVSPGNYTVTIGAGSSSNTQPGGDSWFGTASTIMAKGGATVGNNNSTGASGGTAAASIGTVKFSGGDGADAPLTSGGGGGSSAGTALAGVTATNINGATAPTGGGNGGAGRDGNGDGFDGITPGGGGGGAERSSGTRDGGNGGGGQVIVSFNYPNASCMAALPYNALADNGCGTNDNVVVPVAISGLPTTLGTAAGNARLESVEVIVNHTFNRDIRISLTAPGGVTRSLILDRFGSGNNLGNPAACPGSPLVFADGGTALNTTNTSNVTGTYAPEQTLAGFTGNPNGNWTFTICDNQAADVGNARYLKLNFCTVVTPAVSAAVTTGSNPACSGSSVTFTATPTNGGTTPTYQWTRNGTNISGATSVTYTGTAGTAFVNGDLIRVVMTSNAPCTTNATATSSAITMTVAAPPTTATVGGAQTICTTGTTAALGGNTPSVGTGAWSIIGGGAGTFSPNATTPNATFTHTSGTVTALRWTISNSPCTASTADVSITINQNPTTATVGGAQTICTTGTTAALGGNTPSVGTGALSIIGGGAGTFSPNATTPGATFTHTSGTVTALRWTISNSPCTASFANVSITINQPPTTATVGGAQTICTIGTTAALGGNTPSVGTGAWSIIGGGAGTFSPNATTPGATFTHTSGTVTALRWTISNSPCTASTADVSITINQPPTTATVGSAQTICTTGTTAALGGNTPSVGSGAWSIIGGGAGTFSPNSTTPGATFTHTSGTVTALRWTISNNPCTASFANVSITISQPPTTANAGSNLSTCVSSGTATMAANTPGVGTGAWSFISGPVTATISTPASPTSNISGMTTAGSYVFRWTISNNPCTASTSDVTITSNPLPTTANAGSNQTICTTGGSATMVANTPGIGTGAWSQVSGPVTASIVNSALPTTDINGMTTAGTYVFRWTITNSPCAASTSNVSIAVSTPPTTANAGPPQSICTSVGTALMAANTPSVGTGSWSQVSGPSAASIVSASSPTTNMNGLTTAGNYVFRWTISNNPCTASASDVTIAVIGVPTTANAGSAQTICASAGSVTMNGNTPLAGTGTWSQLSGPVSGTIVSANAPNTSITGLTTAGNYVFRWRITNSPCVASNSSVTITVAPTPTVADAGIDQDICVSPGTTTMAANTALVGAGSWSQISGPTAASIVDASDELTDISGFNQVGAYVFRWTITGSSCPTTTDDVTVNVFGSPSTANAGADQPICSTTGNATMSGNTPSVGTGVWSQVSGPVTATIASASSPATAISDMTTVGTYVFRWTISNGPCSASVDDVNITSGPCAFYSRATGNVSDAIWSDTPTGPAGFASFTALSNMVIQNGHVVSNSGNTSVSDLILQTGGTLNINGATTISVNGNMDIDGTLAAADNSTVALVGSGATTISTTGSPSFYDLTVNTSAGTTLSGAAVIRNTLLLSDGSFDAGTAQLVLASNASSTARLGPVAATASYTGDLTMQRYIPAGATNWRMMGSPVSGQTVNNWKDDFITAGFPGSHSPNFDSPVGSGILWPSVRWYNETNAGPAVIDGLVGATGTSQALAAGQGLAAWCGTGFSTTTAFTVDMTGNPIVASTPIALPMSYTSTGVGATDGWNMVSNPLASPIAFDQMVRGADVEDYITYFDPATGNNATWDISLGSGTNGGTNTIQSSQGFWLKASGAAVTTTVSESTKVSGNTGGFFGDQEMITSLLRLRIASAINQFSDETVVVFNEGAPAINGDDVPKFIFAHPEAPQIATVGDAGQMIAINAFGQYSTEISIPVMVDVAVSGQYTIAANQMANIGLSCLRLEDLATSISTPLVEGASYSFTALADDDASEPRFVIHASAPLALVATDATCAGRDDGQATVEVTSGPVDIRWIDADGLVLLEQNNVQAGPSGIVALEAGDYSISVTSTAGCGTLLSEFSIDAPNAMEVEAIAMPTTCPDSEDGTIDLNVLGGVAPYTYLWSNGAIGQGVTVVAGTYTVVVTDANGCDMMPQEYLVSAGEGPVVGISVESSTVMVNEAVAFFNSSSLGSNYTWDLGDGSTSNAFEPTHTYDQPGIYTVILTADDGTCAATASLELIVETSTGLATIVGHTLNAWVSGEFITIDHTFTNGDPILVRILSTNGQLAQEHRFAAAPARLTLPTAELATGIWLVRISNGPNVRTFSLPVLH